MSQSVMPLRPSLAYGPPEPSAGVEGFRLMQEWSRSVQSFLSPTTRQSEPPAHHPLTRDAAVRVKELLSGSRRALAEDLLERFCASVARLSVNGLPALRAMDGEDGSVLLEWTFKDRRFGFTIEPLPKDSGWYFVMCSGSSERYEAGSLDQLELPRLVRAMLQSQ